MKSLRCLLLNICLLSFYVHLLIADAVVAVVTGSEGGNASVPEDSTVCSDSATCGECLEKGHICAWCETVGFSQSRCGTKEKLMELGCLNYTMPLTESNILENNELTNARGSVNAVQVQPQRVYLKIRIRDTQSIRVKIRQAEDYPVDIYYLMDLSNSMKDDLTKLKSLGETIADAIKNITSDGRLGFGIFVDKPVLPYIRTKTRIPKKFRGSEAPYSFRNKHPLDNNTELFVQRVNETKISRNFDPPEGSMDALMQATVCKDKIGWRERARRIILYTSDGSFHIAGDGRLGGIITPNDGNCHLDNSGEYSNAHLYDYPSIGQLNAKLRENNIITIFAVTSGKYKLYQNLTELIEGSNVERLESDSSNIVEIIKRNYEKITQTVQMVDTTPAGLELSYSSRCTVDGDFQEGNICNDLHLGETVEFDIAITANDCLGSSKNTSFEIKPLGFEEALTVDVDVICECDCEINENPNADACSNGNGSLLCGQCTCNEGRYGKKCECSGDVREHEEEKYDGCRPGNATNVCFGRGECVCGECVCDTRPNPREVISGTYCECDNFSCPRDRGELCGGPERGECVCDKITRQSACKCRPGFKGSACNCPTSQESCRAKNGLVCNAVGDCICGECKCDPNSRFKGPRCDQCATCSEDQCVFHQACLQCKAFSSGRLSKEACDLCLVELIEVQRLPNLEDARNCSFVGDADNCSINFAYQTKSDTQNIIIYYEKNPVCARSSTSRHNLQQDLAMLVSGIVIAIVLIGTIIALIYRIWTYVQDRKEYAQWMKDKEDESWDKEQNPIYKSNVSTFKNPTYNK